MMMIEGDIIKREMNQGIEEKKIKVMMKKKNLVIFILHQARVLREILRWKLLKVTSFIKKEKSKEK